MLIDEGLPVGEAELAEGIAAEQSGQFEEFGREVGAGFDQGREVAHQQVPDGDGEFPRDGGDGVMAMFLHRQFPAPFVQRRFALLQGVLSALDQQRPHVAAAVRAKALFAAPGVVAGLLASRRQAQITHKFFGGGEAVDVANHRHQGKRHAVAHAHLRHLNPFPANTEQVVRSYRKVLIPEVNLGQLLLLIRSRYLVDAVGYDKVRGKPFRIVEIVEEAERLLKDIA